MSVNRVYEYLFGRVGGEIGCNQYLKNIYVFVDALAYTKFSEHLQLREFSNVTLVHIPINQTQKLLACKIAASVCPYLNYFDTDDSIILSVKVSNEAPQFNKVAMMLRKIFDKVTNPPVTNWDNVKSMIELNKDVVNAMEQLIRLHIEIVLSSKHNVRGHQFIPAFVSPDDYDKKLNHA